MKRRATANGRARLGTPLLEVGLVYVAQLGSRRHFRTIFEAGVQSFTLAEDDGQEGLHHCRFIQKMFVIALRKAGARVVLKREVRTS